MTLWYNRSKEPEFTKVIDNSEENNKVGLTGFNS